MGGGGGYFWPGNKSVDQLLNEIEDAESREVFIREVNVFLQSLLINLNDRDTEAIQKHIDTIKKALERDIEGYVDMHFGGSISKHTYANGLSDIDMLVCINDTSLIDLTPGEVLEYFSKRLDGRLPQTKIKIGALAVTVIFSDGHEIQLLPSIATDTGMRISQPDSNNWSNIIKPDKFAQKLKTINQLCNGRVVPIIKIFKQLNNQLPEDLRLSGYYVESLAIKAFGNYNDQKTYHTMLNYFCNYAAKAVLTPIADSTGQSVHVDDHLGESGSILRIQVSKALERLSNRMKRADMQKSIAYWKQLFDEDKK